MDIGQLAKEIGPWAAVSIFLIWWAWKREMTATLAHKELESKVMDRILVVLTDNTKALTEHSLSIRALNDTVGALDETMRKVDSDGLALTQAIQVCSQCKATIIPKLFDVPDTRQDTKHVEQNSH